ncbi:unnamed protein product [Caenorhabditis sp. 36 PRJEB53466]|nr:unnamed protein product [Caenorhabditis sp. 36 PRJEB53466]
MNRSIRILSQAGIARRVELSNYDAQQVEYMREKCISVDENDKIIGAVSKREAHSTHQLILHRAFSVFSFTADNKLLMQKRSAEKITFPNLWTNTCCSHPLHTRQEMNGVLGAKKAAIRKLEHELGITGVATSQLQMAGRYIYRAEMENAPWGEHELDYALILRGVGREKCEINENEVAEVKEVGFAELKQWIHREPQSFTPWLKLFSTTDIFESWVMIKYHVSRSARLWAYWSTLPHKMLKKYPEQTIFYATFGVATVILGGFKLNKYLTNNEKPYYRGYYDVVRSNDPVALNWRKPEEYPAPYLLSSVETAN